MDLGKHGFRRHEHHCAVGSLVRHDVLLRNVVDVLSHVGAKLFLRQRALCVVRLRVEHAVIVLQRKLRVHRHQAGRLGELQHAIHPHAVRKRVLQVEGRWRQDVPDQRFQLHLAEGAARFLVAEQLLQAHHAAGERLDLLLRFVDGRQALHHADEGLVGLAKAFVQPLAHALRDLVEPLVELRGERLSQIGEVPAQPVALLDQAVVQVGEHLAVLFLERPVQRLRCGLRSDSDPCRKTERDCGKRECSFYHG
jgi:hypothetical protein